MKPNQLVSAILVVAGLCQSLYAQGDTLWTRTYGGSDYIGGSSVQQTGPSAPANVVMYGGSGAAAISWDPNPAGENISYCSVYRYTTNNPDLALSIQDVNVPYTHYVDYPSITDRVYWYWVTATDQSSQESPKSPGYSDWVDPPLAHMGGPDNFGYEWIDSREISGTPPRWNSPTLPPRAPH